MGSILECEQCEIWKMKTGKSTPGQDISSIPGMLYFPNAEQKFTSSISNLWSTLRRKVDRTPKSLIQNEKDTRKVAISSVKERNISETVNQSKIEGKTAQQTRETW